MVVAAQRCVIRIVVCAASALTLAGLESMIASAGELRVVARHQRLADAAHDIDRAHPDVIVVAFDEDIEAGLSELGGLLASARIPVVAVIASKAESAWAAELVRAGVRAVLPLDVGSEELHAAIAAAAKNLVSLDADFVPALFSRAASVRGVDGNATHLTARERDVLQMMADGLANKAIAQRIGISTHTVKFHVGSIMSKLNATSRTEAVTLGIRRGLILL